MSIIFMSIRGNIIYRNILYFKGGFLFFFRIKIYILISTIMGYYYDAIMKHLWFIIVFLRIMYKTIQWVSQLHPVCNFMIKRWFMSGLIFFIMYCGLRKAMVDILTRDRGDRGKGRGGGEGLKGGGKNIFSVSVIYKYKYIYILILIFKPILQNRKSNGEHVRSSTWGKGLKRGR